MQKLKKKNLILTLLLLTSLVSHVIFGLETQAEIKKYENEILLSKINQSGLERRNALYEFILYLQGRRLQEYGLQEALELNKTHIGEYTITAYCGCQKCCGKYALNRPNGIVYGASGIELVEGVSVASPLPFGTKLLINNNEYIVQDRTAQWVEQKYDNKIVDIYFDNHADAETFGKQIADVWILEAEK